MNNKSPTLSDSDLTFAIENGIIDESHVRLQVEEMRKKQALENHENKIWKGKTNGLWYTYLVDESGKRKLVKKKNYNDLVNAIAKFDKKSGNTPTFGELYHEWNQGRVDRGRIKRATADRYDATYKSYFQELDGQKITKIAPCDYEDFLETAVGKYHLSSKEFSSIKSLICGVLKIAKRKGLVSFSITEMLEDVDVSSRQFKHTIHEDREEVFDEQETAKITAYLEQNPCVWNDAILLMFCTGLRVGEVVALKPSDIQENSVFVRRTETRYRGDKGVFVYTVSDFPKTAAGVRNVVVPSEYVSFIQTLKRRSESWEYVFEYRGKRITTMAVRKRLKLLCRKLGIYYKSCHKIRKTYATILLDNNVDEATAKAQLGHESILVTERFYHRNRRTLDERERILSDISDFKTHGKTKVTA